MKTRMKPLKLYPLIFFVYFLIIVLASVERWTYYVNLLFAILVVLAICNGKKIRLSTLRIAWGAYILFYAVIGYHLKNPYAILTFSWPYLSALLLLLFTDQRLEQYHMTQNAFVVYSIWVALGFILEAVFERLYIMIAWRLLSRWSYSVGGFTTDRTVGAFIVGVGIIVTATRLLENQSKQKRDIARWLILAFLNLGLLLSMKRTIFIVILIIEMLLYIVASRNRAMAFRRVASVSAVGVLFIGVCITMYRTSGESNLLGRLGYTIIGSMNDIDVSSSREAGYVFMEELWNASDSTRLFGIGWRNVQNGLGRLGHGVYRELLCETGYLGLILYLSIAGGTLIQTGMNLFSIKRYGDQGKLSMIRNSFYIQVFFLLYSFTGNAIYDSFCYLYYFMAIAMNISLGYYVKRGAMRKHGHFRNIPQNKALY